MHYSRYYESLVPYHCWQTLLQKKKAIWKFHQTYIQIFPFTIGSSFTQSRPYIYPELVYIFRSFTFKINVIIISFNMKERHYSLCSEYHSTRNAFGQRWKLTTNNSSLTWKLHHSFLAYCLRCPALNVHRYQRNNSYLKPINSIYFHQKWKHLSPFSEQNFSKWKVSDVKLLRVETHHVYFMMYFRVWLRLRTLTNWAQTFRHFHNPSEVTIISHFDLSIKPVRKSHMDIFFPYYSTTNPNSNISKFE